MGSFWYEDGEDVYPATVKVDDGSNFPPPLDDGTVALVRYENVAWGEYQGTKSIRVKGTVLAPKHYEGRKVSKSLYVTDPNPSWKLDDVDKKRKTARKDLARMDSLHKGKLKGVDGIPTDEQLQLALIGAQQIWTMGVFTPPGDTPRQFVKAINAKGAVELTPDKGKATKSAPAFDLGDDEEDLPF